MSEQSEKSRTAKQKGGPSKEQVIAARTAAKQNMTQASALVYCTARQWSKYEKGDAFMPRASFELYRIKTGQF